MQKVLFATLALPAVLVAAVLAGFGFSYGARLEQQREEAQALAACKVIVSEHLCDEWRAQRDATR